jgi:hypothetical protein
MADEKQNLDGKTPVQATPFDAHEQATRGEHVPTGPDSPDKDPKTVVEFPKAVDHVNHPYTPGHKEPVVVKSAEEEQAYLDAKAEKEAAEVETPAASTPATPAKPEDSAKTA